MSVYHSVTFERPISTHATKTRPRHEPPAHAWEATRALEMAQALQTSLEVEALVELFSAEAAKSVAHDGLRYRHEPMGLEHHVGSRGRHLCRYRLLVGGHSLGELEFSRGRKFSEADTIMLEYMLSSLLYPLRNALLYRQALTKARQDPLTGVKNRSTFDGTLHREVHLAKRHGQNLAVMLVDVDRFKDINDHYGHLIGDCVLRDIAQCLQGSVRESDMVFRYGGEEFVLLLSNTTPQGARRLAERIRRTVEKFSCACAQTEVAVTVSMGVATLAGDESSHDLLERADRALLQAKREGRNRVVVAQEQIES